MFKIPPTTIDHTHSANKREKNSPNKPRSFSKEKDDDDVPFGMTVPLPTPLEISVTYSPNALSSLTIAAPLNENLTTPLNDWILCVREQGIETTILSISLELQQQQEPITFTVRSFDTAQMQIEIDIAASSALLKHMLPQLPALFALLAAHVYPYELTLRLPEEFHNEPLTAATIKKLSEEQKTVYGVHEDEQAP